MSPSTASASASCSTASTPVPATSTSISANAAVAGSSWYRRNAANTVISSRPIAPPCTLRPNERRRVRSRHPNASAAIDAAATPARRSSIGTCSQPWSDAYLSSAATPAISTSMPTLTGTLPSVNQPLIAATALSMALGAGGVRGLGGAGVCDGGGDGDAVDAAGAVAAAALRAAESMIGTGAIGRGGVSAEADAIDGAGAGSTPGETGTRTGGAAVARAASAGRLSRVSASSRIDSLRKRANTMPNAMPAKNPSPAVDSLPTVAPTISPTIALTTTMTNAMDLPIRSGCSDPCRRTIVAKHAAARPRLRQYTLASPGGRVLNRLCIQRYCVGASRTMRSMQELMRAVSATASTLGKSGSGCSRRIA